LMKSNFNREVICVTIVCSNIGQNIVVHHLIPHKLIISTSTNMWSEVIPLNLTNGLMIYIMLS